MKTKTHLSKTYTVCNTTDQVNEARDRGENVWIETDSSINMNGTFKSVRIVRCGNYYARDATFEGDYDVHGATFEGTISFGHTQYNGPTWIDEFQVGPMLELLDACPGGRDAASGAWGNTSWANCPLHDALGMKRGKVASYKDVDAIIESPRLRLAARMFVPLHDAKLLTPPTYRSKP